MATNEYHFVTHWRVPGTVEEVSDILDDPPGLARWWPSVYLDVRQLEPGDADGVGKVGDVHSKGWLPYTLRWQFRVTESRRPHGFSLEAWGDFVGTGRWEFVQDGDDALVTYDWRIRADKPLLRYGSPIFKPFFAANHRWAMARGEESLRLELQRRHAATPEELARIPPPPGVSSSAPVAALAGVALLVIVALAIRRQRHR
jgi:hypothetical protein